MPQTGATRYQKFLKSEKGKTKLKAKKDLPRGTNVTKTNFKVKKIVIKEQLKKHGDTEVLSSRKLNVNELVSRLNHFNTNSRTDALDGIKEVISAHPNILENNLGQLILRVTPLILNIEKIIRRESLHVLHAMLSNVSVEKIDPFYDVMSTYLRSAMTHIDNRIQEDSLIFLDTLLLCAPNKVAQDFHKIIPNFLDMISKLRVDSKPGRTLTVNLGSQVTSVKWRVKVLQRLQDYLSKFIQQEHVNNSDKIIKDTTKKFNDAKYNYFPLFDANYTTVCNLPSFSSKKSQEAVPIDEVEKFLEYINTLMLLLFETWLEVCPASSSTKNIETVVNEDAALLLKNSLKIISLLWTLVQYLNKKNPTSNIQNIFCQKYCQSYTQHFVKMFPYITNIKIKQRNETSTLENNITDPKLTADNLEICHLFILLNPNVNVKSSQETVQVLNYIEKVFNDNTPDDINNLVVNTLHTIFSRELNSWTRTVAVMDAVFKKIVWAYLNKKMSNSFKQKIFSLLCNIALNENLVHFHQSETFNMWLIKLPDILLEESINIQTVDILHKFSVRNNKTFNSVVKPKLTKIIENLPLIKISDAVYDTNSYHKLFSVLYWIKSWDTESLNLLEQQLMSNMYQSDHGQYIFDTLRLRTGGM